MSTSTSSIYSTSTSSIYSRSTSSSYSTSTSTTYSTSASSTYSSSRSSNDNDNCSSSSSFKSLVSLWLFGFSGHLESVCSLETCGPEAPGSGSDTGGLVL